MKRWIQRNINEIESDCKIIRYKGDSYYLLLTVESKIKQDLNTIPFDIASADPGQVFISNSLFTEWHSDGNRKLLCRKRNNTDCTKSR